MRELIKDRLYCVSFKQNDSNIIDGNIYILKKEKVLIDTGIDDREVNIQLIKSLQIIGLSINDLNYVILTHHHQDHVGGLVYLPESIPVICAVNMDFYTGWRPIMALPRELDKLNVSDMGKYFISSQFLIQHRIGVLNNRPVQFIGQKAKKISGLTIMAVTGHSPTDLFIFWSEFNAAFTGDFLLKDVVFDSIIDIDFNGGITNQLVDNYLNNLAKWLPSLSIVYPGHGLPIVDVGNIVDNKIKRLNKMVHRAERQDFKNGSLEELMNQIFPGFAKFSYFLPFSETYSIMEYLRKGEVQ